MRQFIMLGDFLKKEFFWQFDKGYIATTPREKLYAETLGIMIAMDLQFNAEDISEFCEIVRISALNKATEILNEQAEDEL